MAQHKAQNHVAAAIESLNKAIGSLHGDIQKASPEDLKEGTKIAMYKYKNDPMLQQGLEELRKRGINL